MPKAIKNDIICPNKEGDKMTKYRYDIGIDKNQIFGTETEFSEASLKDLAKIFKKEKLNIIYQKNHYNKKPTYESWYLDKDSTISWDTGTDILGGEISSRLLTNNKETWKELKKFLKILKSAGATISGCCSTQVSIDIADINNSNKEQTFYKTLIEVLILYEKDIELFYMGKKYFKRQTKDYYAKNMKQMLLEKLLKVRDANIVNYHDLLVYDEPIITQSIYGIKLDEQKERERIEIRYPNGTLDEKVLQNYINFSLKLITACKNGTLDQEQLAYLTRREIKLYEEGKDHIYESNPQNFENLIETISTCKEDIEDFAHQYQKVLSSKNKKDI